MTGCERVRVEFRGVRLGQLQHVAREFNRRDLHPQAQAEIGDFIFAGVLRRLDFAFHAAFAKPARHQDAAQAAQNFFRAVLFDLLGVHLHDFHAAIVGHAAVDDRLVNRFVGVLQLDVFADHADADAMLRRDEFADDLLPVRHVRRGRGADAAAGKPDRPRARAAASAALRKWNGPRPFPRSPPRAARCRTWKFSGAIPCRAAFRSGRPARAARCRFRAAWPPIAASAWSSIRPPP